MNDYFDQAAQIFEQMEPSKVKTMSTARGKVMIAVMNGYIKAGFTKEQAFELLKEEVDQFRVEM